MLELDQIQADILRGYVRGTQLPFARYLFYRFSPQTLAAAPAMIGDSPGRCFVRALVSAKLITTTSDWDAAVDLQFSLSLALSARGMAAAGVPKALLDQYPAEFLSGMAARSLTLGDTGPSDPSRWQFGGPKQPELHALVSISSQTAEGLAAGVACAESLIKEIAGVELVYSQAAAALASGTEHFGFVDGIGQPSVRGDGAKALPGQGTPRLVCNHLVGWKPLEPGEFVLGYPNEQESHPACPPLGKNGSFLVFRKLAEDVTRFRRYLADKSVAMKMPQKELAANLIGRWQSGAPLELSPHCDDPALGADPQRNDNFRYGNDKDGYRCPIGAHVRRANPRDDLDSATDKVSFHRIIRRGITYGAALPEGAPDDGVDRGLCFAVVNAHLDRQFEFVQGQWLDTGGSSRALGDSKDAVTGGNDGDGHLIINGAPPRIAGDLERFVTTLGGDYFFLPGLAALREIADGTGWPGPESGPDPRSMTRAAAEALDVLQALEAPFAKRQIHVKGKSQTAAPPEVTTALAVMAPIKKEQVDAVKRMLAEGANQAPLTTLGTVHYTRFALFDHFPNDGQDEPPPRFTYLFFHCVFDGTKERFTAELAAAIARHGYFVWDFCLQYPGVQDLAAFRLWLERANVPVGFAYARYPSATVRSIKQSLRFKERFIRFMNRAQSLPPIERQRAYEQLVRDSVEELD